MQNSIFSRSHLRTLLRLSPQRNGVATGTWGSIVEGQGWHEIEYDGDQPFRWGQSGASIKIAPRASTWLPLDLEIEPGPSLVDKQLRLELCDSEGECVASVSAAGRQTIHIVLPVDSVAPNILTLQVKGDVQKVPGEPRCLSYRVFSLRESAPLLSSKLRFEDGWHAYESADGKYFRWASNCAAIRAHATRSNPVLTADLEPGPGTEQRPFRVDLLKAGGERIFTTSIRTRQQVQSRLPMKLGEFGVFHFSVDESMIVRAPQDSRALAFRTFGIAIS
jgi:hypothetical protein